MNETSNTMAPPRNKSNSLSARLGRMFGKSRKDRESAAQRIALYCEDIDETPQRHLSQANQDMVQALSSKSPQIYMQSGPSTSTGVKVLDTTSGLVTGTSRDACRKSNLAGQQPSGKPTIANNETVGPRPTLQSASPLEMFYHTYVAPYDLRLQSRKGEGHNGGEGKNDDAAAERKRAVFGGGGGGNKQQTFGKRPSKDNTFGSIDSIFSEEIVDGADDDEREACMVIDEEFVSIEDDVMAKKENVFLTGASERMAPQQIQDNGVQQKDLGDEELVNKTSVVEILPDGSNTTIRKQCLERRELGAQLKNETSGISQDEIKTAENAESPEIEVQEDEHQHKNASDDISASSGGLTVSQEDGENSDNSWLPSYIGTQPPKFELNAQINNASVDVRKTRDKVKVNGKYTQVVFMHGKRATDATEGEHRNGNVDIATGQSNKEDRVNKLVHSLGGHTSFNICGENVYINVGSKKTKIKGYRKRKSVSSYVPGPSCANGENSGTGNGGKGVKRSKNKGKKKHKNKKEKETKSDGNVDQTESWMSVGKCEKDIEESPSVVSSNPEEFHKIADSTTEVEKLQETTQSFGEDLDLEKQIPPAKEHVWFAQSPTISQEQDGYSVSDQKVDSPNGLDLTPGDHEHSTNGIIHETLGEDEDLNATASGGMSFENDLTDSSCKFSNESNGGNGGLLLRVPESSEAFDSHTPDGGDAYIDGGWVFVTHADCTPRSEPDGQEAENGGVAGGHACTSEDTASKSVQESASAAGQANPVTNDGSDDATIGVDAKCEVGDIKENEHTMAETVTVEAASDSETYHSGANTTYDLTLPKSKPTKTDTLQGEEKAIEATGCDLEKNEDHESGRPSVKEQQERDGAKTIISDLGANGIDVSDLGMSDAEEATSDMIERLRANLSSVSEDDDEYGRNISSSGLTAGIDSGRSSVGSHSAAAVLGDVNTEGADVTATGGNKLDRQDATIGTEPTVAGGPVLVDNDGVGIQDGVVVVEPTADEPDAVAGVEAQDNPDATAVTTTSNSVSDDGNNNEVEDLSVTDDAGFVDVFALKQTWVSENRSLNKLMKKYRARTHRVERLQQLISQLKGETTEMTRMVEQLDRQTSALRGEAADMRCTLSAICNTSATTLTKENEVKGLEPTCFRRYTNIRTTSDAANLLNTIRNRMKALAELEVLVYRKQLVIHHVLPGHTNERPPTAKRTTRANNKGQKQKKNEETSDKKGNIVIEVVSPSQESGEATPSWSEDVTSSESPVTDSAPISVSGEGGTPPIGLPDLVDI